MKSEVCKGEACEWRCVRGGRVQVILMKDGRVTNTEKGSGYCMS